MVDYQRLDALEIENQLRAYLDGLVRLAGGRLTVYRIARIVLDDMRATHTLEERARQTRVEAIIKATADAHNIPVDDVMSRDRTHKVAWCRHHAIWEIRQRRADLGLCKIALWLNRADHATIINSLRKFNKAIKDGHYNGERTLVERALSC